MKIVLATKNPGKLRELSAMAEGRTGLNFELAPEEFDPEETGSTYLDNAIIKATLAGRMTNMVAVADDSGIEILALDGRPGVHSARYCQGSDDDRRHKLIFDLKDVPEGKRQAQYVCWMVVYDPQSDSVIYRSEGVWKGRIGFEERGSGGFGYDPIFYLENSDVTAAQLPAVEKNLKSHRGQAWRQVLDFLEKTFIHS